MIAGITSAEAAAHTAVRRLEDEAEEFRSFLERLRAARDKVEFDQFMEERKSNGDKPKKSDKPDDNAGTVPQTG